MSIRLNNMKLDDELLWENEFESAAASQQVALTLGGRTTVSTMPIEGGREIMLTAKLETNGVYGKFSRTQAIAIKALEKSQATVVLEYEGQIINVKVKAGGVVLKPLQARPNQAATDEYAGTVTFIEV